MSDRIDGYLDELAERLQWGGLRVRRLLAETEDHLRESAAALRAGGLGDDAAATAAIARFGSADVVARRMRPTRAALAVDAVLAGWLLGGVGLAAIGASGLLAWLLRVAAGPGFVAGDSFGVTYTEARCVEFLEYFPQAGGCAAAAALHHADEVVSYRLAAGMLGLAMLAGYALFRRRSGVAGSAVLPPASAPMVAAVLFGAAGAALLLDAAALWLGEVSHREPVAGVGDPLSAGIVAVVAATIATILTVRRLGAHAH